MNKTYNIKDNKIFLLDDNSVSYFVEEGSANVYISEFDNGQSRSRLFLRQIKKGDCVCGLNYTESSKTYNLFLVNCDRDSSGKFLPLTISTADVNLKDQIAFADKIDKYLFHDNYAYDLVQFYLFMQMKGARHIYGEYRSTNQALNSTISNVYSTFNVRQSSNDTKNTNTNQMYFALNKLANFMNIKSVPYYNFDLDELANLTPEMFSDRCGCIYRNIRLEPGWHNEDFGPFVAYYGKDRLPVVCAFKRNAYYMYKDNISKPVKINKNVAQNFDEDAFIFYRSFPDENLNYKDIIKFIALSIPKISLINSLLISLLITLIGLLTPILNQFIYDRLIPSDDYIGVYGCCSVLIGILLGSACFSLVKGYLTFSISSKIKYSLQCAFFDRIFKLRQSFIKKYEPADLSMRILGISSIFTSITTTVVSTVVSLLFSFIYLIQMKNFMPNLLVPGILISFIMFFILIVFSHVQYKWIAQGTQLNIDKSSFLFQIIRGISKIRVAGAEDRALNKYINKHLDSSKLNYKIGFYTSLVLLLGSIFTVITTIMFFTIIYYDGLVDTVGSIMGFITAYGAFTAILYQIPTCYSAFLQARPWFERLKPIIHENPEKNSGTKLLKNIEGKIEVSHLTFSYDENSPIVLDDISFKINPGEYVGIVGPSGCGKTTLLNLLLGFETPNKGKIYYDNNGIDDVDKKLLRQNFGVVLQDGDLISGSILDNITIANNNASLDDIKNVLKVVGLYEEVERMPMGVNTVLSEGSGLISGGQKQRILIARAIVGKPKILFFDEATSALDNVTQAHITDNLNKLGGTRVVIAHRLSTIINCDRIIVFNKGKIVEVGTYNELLNNKGLFYNLVQRQIS